MPKIFTGMDAMREIWAQRDPVRVETRNQMASINKLNSATIPQDALGVTPGTVNPSGNAMRLYTDYVMTTSGDTLTCSPSESKIISVYVDSTVGFIHKTLEAAITLSTAGYTTGKNYDVFVYWDNSIDSFVLSTQIWTNDTTRAVALTTIDGTRVLSTDETQRYLLTGRYNGTALQVTSADNNGLTAWGTGNPYDPTGADPYTGTIASQKGVYCYNAGVLQAYIDSSTGKILWAAGKGYLDSTGEVLIADVYPSSAYLAWKAADTAATVGELIGTYAGAVTNSGLLIFGQAHDGAVRGFVSVRVKDNTGTEKTTETLDTNGTWTLDTSLVDGSTTGAYILASTSANNAIRAVLNLQARTSNGSFGASGLGGAINFTIEDSAGNDQQAGYFGLSWIDATNTSEDAQYVLALAKNVTVTTMLTIDGTTGMVMSGIPINEAQGSDIASAGTTNIGAASGNYVKVTGTTTITSFGTVQAGTARRVQFTGALTLTHNATSLILPGGANITTVAGDTAEFVSEGSGNWKCTYYSRGGNVPSAYATGVATFLATPSSANLRAALTDENGTGAALFDGATPTALNLANATALPLTTGVTGILPTANGGTGTANPWIAVKKTAIETISSDNTLNNDSALSVTLAASTAYSIRGRVFFDTSAAADFKYRWNYTGTFTTFRGRVSHIVPGTAADVPSIETSLPTATNSVVGAGTTGGFVEIDMYLLTNATGTFVFQWSQNTSDASNTSVQPGYFEYMVMA